MLELFWCILILLQLIEPVFYVCVGIDLVDLKEFTQLYDDGFEIRVHDLFDRPEETMCDCQDSNIQLLNNSRGCV